MTTDDRSALDNLLDIENAEWRESLDYVLQTQGPDRVRQLLRLLQTRAQEQGVSIPFTANTPYINTIPRNQQPVFPGNREIERRIKSIVRWNAMAMVVRANREVHRHRRPHLHLRLGRHPLGGRLQPLLARPHRRLPRRHGLLPGPRLARHLRPRLPRGAPDASRTWSTSATSWHPRAACPPTPTPS